MILCAIGDLHCGHRGGLTPPAWQTQAKRSKPEHDLQAEMWRRFEGFFRSKKPDALIVNGDAIDGRGEKSGGTELITGDREEQCAMAVACIRATKAKRIYLTRGTPYHTGTEEDWENWIAREVGAEITDHLWLEAGGVVFDARHHVGGSSVPYGRHGAVAKERLWNLLWADVGNQPRAGVYLRSHVHYHSYAGGPGWLAMTLPALQAPATRFGRRCSGTVDWGVAWFDVQKGEVRSWQAETVQLQAAACAVRKLS